MASMAAFLDYLDTPEAEAMYARFDTVQDQRAEQLNRGWKWPACRCGWPT
jgi:glutamate-1-semialdehyde 2,1-aminomutase